jgi:hypothetical protein
LSMLDFQQWRQLGAPMGLAAAVKYYASSTNNERWITPETAPTLSMVIPPSPIAKETPPEHLPSPTTLSSELEEAVLEAVLDRSAVKEEGIPSDIAEMQLEENPLADLPSSTPLRAATKMPLEEAEAETSNMEESAAVEDSVEDASVDDVNMQTTVEQPESPKRQSLSVAASPDAVNSTPEVLKNCQNLVRSDKSCETTESTDDEGDGDGDDSIAVQKLDFDKVFAESSPQPSTDDDDHGIPRIAITGSSDEEDDDPEAVAELVGSLDRKETRLWLEQQDRKQNDDDVTVVVSNVSPERKCAVQRELSQKKATTESELMSASRCVFDVQNFHLNFLSILNLFQSLLRVLQKRRHLNPRPEPCKTSWTGCRTRTIAIF